MRKNINRWLSALLIFCMLAGFMPAAAFAEDAGAAEPEGVGVAALPAEDAVQAEQDAEEAAPAEGEETAPAAQTEDQEAALSDTRQEPAEAGGQPGEAAAPTALEKTRSLTIQAPACGCGHDDCDSKIVYTAADGTGGELKKGDAAVTLAVTTEGVTVKFVKGTQCDFGFKTWTGSGFATAAANRPTLSNNPVTLKYANIGLNGGTLSVTLEQGAVEKPAEYKINFNGNGGKLGSTSGNKTTYTTTKTYAAGSTVDLAAALGSNKFFKSVGTADFTKAYDVVGWNTNQTAARNGTKEFEGSMTMPDAEPTLYAVWGEKENRYVLATVDGGTLSYKFNGIGTGAQHRSGSELSSVKLYCNDSGQIPGGCYSITATGPAGAEFQGWFFNGSRIDALGDKTKLSGSTLTNAVTLSWSNFSSGSNKLEARFQAVPVTVTVQDGKDGALFEDYQVQVEYGSALADLEIPAVEGWEFDHWALADGSEAPETITESITLVAVWKEKYTVTYNAGKEGDYAVLRVFEVSAGSLVPEYPELPVLEGYIFKQWNKGYAKDYQVNSNIVFEARWQKISDSTPQWTLLVGEGGKVHISIAQTWTGMDLESGASITLTTSLQGRNIGVDAPYFPMKALPDEGYEFVGWSRVNKGVIFTNDTIAKNEKNKVFPLMGNDPKYWQNMTITALFERQKLSVTIRDGKDGALFEEYQVQVEYGSALADLEAPAAEGYRFVGWTLADGGEAPETITEAVTLAAVWVKTYTLSFDTDGGEPIDALTVDEGGKVTLPAPERTGYLFLGWKAPDDRVYAAGEEYTVNADATLLAQWQVENCTLHFDPNGGTGGPADKQYEYGQTVTVSMARSPAKRDGFQFLGWDEDPDASYPAFAYYDGQHYGGYPNYRLVMDSDKTLYAIWGELYKLHYDMNAGDDEVSTTVRDQEGTWVDVTVWNCRRTGYRFLGFAFTPDATEASTDPNFSYSNNQGRYTWYRLSGDTTLYAVWALESYTYTFNLNGAEAGTRPADITVTAQDTQTPYLPSAEELGLRRTGYDFLGWSFTQKSPTLSGLTAEFEGGKNMAAEDVVYANRTIYAVWKIQTCTIHFDLNGGKGNFFGDKTVNVGDSYTLPASVPTRDGYTFTGWLADDGTVYQRGDKLTVTADVTLTAQWVLSELTVKFNANGSGVTNLPETITAKADGTALYNGDTVKIPDQKPIRVGYVLNGWATSRANANAATPKIVCRSGDEYQLSVIGGQTVVQLWASWTAASFTVSYDLNGGEGTVPDAATVPASETITLADAPTMTGYSFLGWSDGTALYDAGAAYQVEADTVLTAQWQVNQYSIRFDSDGGSEVAPLTLDYGAAVTAPADPSKTGYSFLGWDPALPETMPAEDLTVKAQWKINRYSIRFDSDGGSEIAPITQDYGTAITAPADPSKTGYSFQGWDPALPETMPAEDLTVKAQWKINRYTIRFDSDGGSEVAPITQDYGTAITAPADPTRLYYSFTGWTPALPAAMPAEDLTLTAGWTPVEYTVTVDPGDGSEPREVKLTVEDKLGDKIDLSDPAWDGHLFQGWVDQNGMPVDPDALFTPSLTQIRALWKVDYKIIKGANSTFIKGSGKDLLIASDAPFEKFVSVIVDGQVLDPANYKAASGSTEITLSKDYLERLKLGSHSFTIRSSDGEASTHFYVKTDSGTVVAPKSGDDSPAALYALGLLASLSLGGASLLILRGRRREDAA